MMKILAISGSLRAHSYNTALLRQAASINLPEWNITQFDSLATVPLFNPDSENGTVPETVSRLRQAIGSADAVIISTPEYAHGIPGALKNALDWLVSCNEMILKPVAVMSVSTSNLGGYRAHADLIKVLHAMNTNVIIDASLNVPFAKMKFNAQGELVDPESLKALENALLRIAAFVRQQQ